MELTDDMQRVVEEQQLGFVATVTPDGRPNVSPKGTTAVLDRQRLIFADVASPNTVRNLTRNPAVEVNVVDPIVRKGYRFRGAATVHTDDDTYARGLEMLAERGSSLRPDQVRSFVVIEVAEAEELISPAYDLGLSEEAIVAGWLDRINRRHGRT